MSTQDWALDMARSARRQRRIDEWIRANPPTLYFRTVNDVTAVIRKIDYDIAVQKRKASVNGVWKSDTLRPVRETFVFVHKTVVDQVPKNYRSGWFSDFEDLRRIATVEIRDDIFVPFALGSVLSKDRTRRLIINLRTLQGVSDNSRLRVAREKLIWQDVPTEVKV